MPKKLALDSGIQTNQILKNDDEICIPHIYSILLLCNEKLEWRARTGPQNRGFLIFKGIFYPN